MESVFNSYDKNGDDKLDFDEFRYLCNAIFRDDKGRIYKLDEAKIQEIFDVFDENHDTFIDRKEFTFCWDRWIKIMLRPIALLIVCDVQNDFINGSFNLVNCPAQHDASEIIGPLNHILENIEFRMVAYSIEWHPHDHICFIDNLNRREVDPSSGVTAEEAQLFDKIKYVGIFGPVEQRLMPRHCVQNTWGAELSSQLVIADNGIKVLKGTNPDIDGYSAFRDDIPLGETTFTEMLKHKKITDVFIGGVAYDLCVANTALDSLSLGYRTIVLDDCSRGIFPEQIDLAKNIIKENSGVIVNSQQVKGMVEGTDRRPELGYKLAMELKLARLKLSKTRSNVATKTV